jgi:multiple sugar transport system substrate-binding protein
MHDRDTMAKKGKRLLALLGGAAAVAAMGSAGSASADTTLRMMHQGTAVWIASYGEVVKRFEAANPGVKVELMYTPHDVYNEKVAAAVSAKNLPDIIELDAPFLANYVWAGYLRPMDGLLSKALLDDMTPSNIAQSTYPVDGKLYATGLTDSSVVLYAHKKYLKAIGARLPKGVDDAWTGQEFEDILTKLSKVEGVKWPIDLFRSYGTKTEWVPYAFEPVFVSMGCDFIDRKTWKATGALDSDACVKAAETLGGWVAKGWVVPASAGGNQFFTGGQPAAVAWGGHWFHAEAANGMKGEADDIAVLPLPKFGAKGASPNGTWIWGVTATSKNPELAGKFIEFMLTDKAHREVAKSDAGFPGLKSFAAESPLYAAGGPLAVAFEQASKTAVERPPHPAYPAITLAVQEAMDKIFNKVPAKQALAEAAKKIDEDIADNEGYPPFGGK